MSPLRSHAKSSPVIEPASAIKNIFFTDIKSLSRYLVFETRAISIEIPHPRITMSQLTAIKEYNFEDRLMASPMFPGADRKHDSRAKIKDNTIDAIEILSVLLFLESRSVILEKVFSHIYTREKMTPARHKTTVEILIIIDIYPPVYLIEIVRYGFK